MNKMEAVNSIAITMKKRKTLINIILFVLCMILISGCSRETPGYQQISQDEAKKMMESDDGHLILDVRTKEEFDSGHIPGAICIPVETIEDTPPGELPDKEQIILVYCRSGRRSKDASEKLAKMGYTHIYEFGGIIDWDGETVEETSDETVSNQNTADQEKLTTETEENNVKSPVLLFQGHGSVRIVTPEEKVIYIDPFAGEGYDLPADLILITHGHFDHNQTDLIKERQEGCRVITQKEALEGGNHQSFDLDYVQVQAVEAGYNKNHDVKKCVGYVLTFSNNVKVYLSGDTSKTPQMANLGDIDYAFFCCDGVYNMDTKEAGECAKLVGATHSIPYHMLSADPENNFDMSIAESFEADGRIILKPGEELELKK